MANPYFIKSYCKIQDGKIALEGAPYFEAGQTFGEFSKLAYQHIGLNYPKFFKMDNMSKLAMLASEPILRNNVDPSQENDVAIVFANKSSSLDTDVRYQKSIADPENYFPSPAVFVYTLANICIGEISIRHQLKSENCFFIFETFDADVMFAYADSLLRSGKAEQVLAGWIELYDEHYHAFMYLVAADGTIEHTKQNIEFLYNR
ncbi:MAG: 3-oxoacyl-ACP synthase [Flavobacterium sp.]|nr:3-oxoacyl-ACP synthase [Flavobacterium sp.]